LKAKVYLVWLHDDVVSVHASWDSARAAIAREQGRLGGDWGRHDGGNRWFHTESSRVAGHRVSRLEIQMREVQP
jgi:hypothetical protein